MSVGKQSIARMSRLKEAQKPADGGIRTEAPELPKGDAAPKPVKKTAPKTRKTVKSTVLPKAENKLSAETEKKYPLGSLLPYWLL